MSECLTMDESVEATHQKQLTHQSNARDKSCQLTPDT